VYVNNKKNKVNMHTQHLFNGHSSLELLKAGSGSSNKTFGITDMCFLHDKCPAYHPTTVSKHKHFSETYSLILTKENHPLALSHSKIFSLQYMSVVPVLQYSKMLKKVLDPDYLKI